MHCTFWRTALSCSKSSWEGKHNVCSQQPHAASALGHFIHTAGLWLGRWWSTQLCWLNTSVGAQLWSSHLVCSFLSAASRELSPGRVVWMPFCPHSARPEQGHMRASRKSQDFLSIHSHGRMAASCNRVDQLLRWEISLSHIMMLGKAGGSSKEGCTQMLTWGMKAVLSRRWHVGDT